MSTFGLPDLTDFLADATDDESATSTQELPSVGDYNLGPPFTQAFTRLPSQDTESEKSSVDSSRDSTPVTGHRALPSMNERPIPLNVGGSASTRKHARDDEVDFLSERAARKAKLSKEGEKMLSNILKMPQAQQNAYLMAVVIRTQELAAQLQPAEAAWTMPKLLHAKIETYSADVLLCAELSAYMKQPTKIVLDILERHPTWGFTKAVRDNKIKLEVVNERVQTRLTERRSDIKSVICASIGTEATETEGRRTDALNIVELVHRIIDRTHRSMRVKPDMSVTIAMCSRFAFLRQMYRDDSTTTFWKSVDSALERIRKRLGSKPKELTSKYFKQVLDQDLRLYGGIDLDDVVDVNRTIVQREIDALTTGDLDSIPDVFDCED